MRPMSTRATSSISWGGIEGAFDRASAGLDDARAGRTIQFDKL